MLPKEGDEADEENRVKVRKKVMMLNTPMAPKLRMMQCNNPNHNNNINDHPTVRLVHHHPQPMYH